jgi:hypothetical protein
MGPFMPQETPPPKRSTESWALIAGLVIVAIFIFAVLAVRSFSTSPQKLPTGQVPDSNAPVQVETPEEAKPPAQRESN